jgi:hypothetical protein
MTTTDGSIEERLGVDSRRTGELKVTVHPRSNIAPGHIIQSHAACVWQFPGKAIWYVICLLIYSPRDHNTFWECVKAGDSVTTECIIWVCGECCMSIGCGWVTSTRCPFWNVCPTANVCSGDRRVSLWLQQSHAHRRKWLYLSAPEFLPVWDEHASWPKFSSDTEGTCRSSFSVAGAGGAVGIVKGMRDLCLSRMGAEGADQYSYSDPLPVSVFFSLFLTFKFSTTISTCIQCFIGLFVEFFNL